MKKAEADQTIQKIINEYCSQGYRIGFKNHDKTILIDHKKNIKSFERSWSLFKGYDFYEQSIKYDNLKKIKVVVLPSQLTSAYNEYAIGGALTGGLAGLLVGSIIDDLRGPKKENISVDFEFREKGGWNGDIIFFSAYSRSNIPMVDKEVKPIVKDIIRIIDKAKVIFPDKVEIL